MTFELQALSSKASPIFNKYERQDLNLHTFRY